MRGGREGKKREGGGGDRRGNAARWKGEKSWEQLAVRCFLKPQQETILCAIQVCITDGGRGRSGDVGGETEVEKEGRWGVNLRGKQGNGTRQ